MRCAYLRKMVLGMAVVWLILGWFSVALSAQIKLAWDANTEPDLAGYKVYHGTASNSYGAPIDVGNVTSYTLTGLTEGQTYYISLTAYDSLSNESGHSNEVSGVATGPSQTVAITIATNPTGLQVTVDGATLPAPQTFDWTAGSSHTVGTSSPQDGTAGTRYAFASWSDGGGQTHTVTAPSSAATYTATFTTQFTLTTSASAGGTVNPSGTNWYNSAQPVTVTATPSAGYIFSNWSGDNTGSSNPLTITMNAPTSVTAIFNLIPEAVSTPSAPSGLSSVTTGIAYTYTTGGSTSNLGHSLEYRFDWGDGTYSVWSSSTSASKTWSSTGTYLLRAQARCATHTDVVSAGSNSISVTVTQATVSCTVSTSPAGLRITVDEANYDAPHTFNWIPGTLHILSVGSPQNGASGTRYVYSNWSDGGAQTHAVTIPSSAAAYTATFATQYSLATSASAGGTVDPSGTNWYNNAQPVTVTATPSAGYIFSNWSGDLTGPTNPATITMDVPKNVSANFTQSQCTLAVSVNPAGSGSVSRSPDKAAYDYGEQVTLIATPGANYSFSGWSGDLAGTTNSALLTMNGNKAVTANFSAIAGGALSVIPSNGFNSSGVKGGPFSPTSYTYTLQNPGGTVINWMASKSQSWISLSQETGSLSPGASATVTVSINGAANNLNTGSYGDSIAFTNTGDHSGDAARSVSLAVNAGAPVSHRIDSHPTGLKVWVDGVSYKTPKKLKWEVGSTHTVSTVDPQDGPSGKRYRFSSWSDGGPITHSVTAPAGSSTYTADFVTEFSLNTSVNDPSRGIVFPSGDQWYGNGETVLLTAVPLEGYIFKNWKNASGVVIGKDNPRAVTMNGAKKIKANFAHITYSLVVNKVPPDGGTVSKIPSKTKYFPGEQVTLTATPRYGYTFGGWGGDATGIERTIIITVDGERTVTANFALDPNVPRVPPAAEKTEERLPLIGGLESPGDGKTLSGVKPIYGWALDGEAVTKVELFIDSQYVCQIPYGGLREDIGGIHPGYPEAEKAGFALVWNYSVLPGGEHTVGIRVHNSKRETLDLSATISVVKFHGDVVSDMNSDTPYAYPVTVTADGVTRTYEVNLQWLGESQDFGIVDIIPKD